MADLHKNTIRIRMYRVGFGDCFLLSLPTDSGHAHILVDCGAHFKGDIGTLESALRDALEQAKNQLAVVIATHPHQDHVSGFGRYESQFRRCRIREVWLPWTEDPHDNLAVRLKTKSLALIEQLKQHFAASPPSLEAQLALLNLAVTPKTGRLLQSGITNGLVRYLGAGTTCTSRPESRVSLCACWDRRATRSFSPGSIRPTANVSSAATAPAANRSTECNHSSKNGSPVPATA